MHFMLLMRWVIPQNNNDDGGKVIIQTEHNNEEYFAYPIAFNVKKCSTLRPN